jgi:hypothetical protein
MADVVTLVNLKQYLRIPPTDVSNDMALLSFIAAADDVLEAECGVIMPKHYDEYYDGGNYVIYLRHRPVLSIENVEEGWGWWNWELDFQQVNTVPAGAMFAYSVDSPNAGGISRRSAGNVSIPFVAGRKNIRVLYTAGRLEVGPSIILAALELIAFWWQNTQLRAMANSQAYTSFNQMNEDWTRSTGVTSINYGIPNSVIELLKKYRRIPIIG